MHVEDANVDTQTETEFPSKYKNNVSHISSITSFLFGFCLFSGRLVPKNVHTGRQEVLVEEH